MSCLPKFRHPTLPKSSSASLASALKADSGSKIGTDLRLRLVPGHEESRPYLCRLKVCALTWSIRRVGQL